MSESTVAAVQMKMSADPAENLAHAEALLREAAEQGADAREQVKQEGGTLKRTGRVGGGHEGWRLGRVTGAGPRILGRSR